MTKSVLSFWRRTDPRKTSSTLEYLDQEYVKYSKIKESLTDDSKEHIRRRKEEVEDLLGDIMEALCYYEL